MSTITHQLKNTETTAVPPFALVEIVRAVPFNDPSAAGDLATDSLLEVRQPTGEGSVVAVGPAGLAPEGYGEGYTGRPFVRFGGREPLPDDELRATVSQWYATADGDGAAITANGDPRTIPASEPPPAPDFDNGVDYETGQRVTQGGVVYEALVAVEAGPFDAADWKEVDASTIEIVRVTIDESSGSPPVRAGVVSSGSPATSQRNGNDLTLGSVSVWKYLTEDEVDTFDEGESYDPEKPVRLTATPHDESTTYTESDTVLSGGNVYQAQSGDAAIGSSGAFDAADWTLLDSEGVKFATTSVSAGPYDSAEWDAATGDRYVDRTRTPLTLDNHFTDAVNEGAIAKWIGTRLIGYGCSAQEGWS